MSDCRVGYAMGMVTGLAIGLIATRKQKLCTDLTENEKKIRIELMATLGILVIAGIIVLLMCV